MKAALKYLIQSVYPQLLNAEYIIDTMLILVLFSLDLLQITSLFAGVKIGLSLKYFTYELMRFVAPEEC